MKNSKLLMLLGAVCMAFTLQSCKTMEASADTSIDDAKAEIKKAKAMGFEWRDSAKMLKKAQKALDAGDTETANKLIAKAKKQGMDAQMQAKAQMEVSGPH